MAVDSLSAAEQRVRIAYLSRSVSSALLLIAQDKGFFHDEGLALQIILSRATTAIAGQRTLIRQKLTTVSSERGRRDRRPWAPERRGCSQAPTARNITLRGWWGGLRRSVLLPTAVGRIAFAGSR